MKYAENMSELIGETPLVKINRLNPELSNNIFAKLEFFKPAHSVKDRPAFRMLRSAEKEGKIGKGSLIVEATSGNMGIGLAWLCSVYGMRLIIVMPENMSAERKKILEFFGAEVLLTPAETGMAGAVCEAGKIFAANPGAFMPSQFDNPANPESHYSGTGPELWRDLEGKIDFLVCGVGTGGTITGAGRYLKEKNPGIKLVAVEPASSAVLSGDTKGRHKIQGIGAGFVPAVLDLGLIDEIIKISDEEAGETSRALAMEEGILAGISSGAAMKAARDVSLRERGKSIVALFPDTGERYISSWLFGD